MGSCSGYSFQPKQDRSGKRPDECHKFVSKIQDITIVTFMEVVIFAFSLLNLLAIR